MRKHGRGSLSAMVKETELRSWDAPDGRKGWEVRCPGCAGMIRRPGPVPRAGHPGSYKCGSCGRRVVVI